MGHALQWSSAPEESRLSCDTYLIAASSDWSNNLKQGGILIRCLMWLNRDGKKEKKVISDSVTQREQSLLLRLSTEFWQPRGHLLNKWPRHPVRHLSKGRRRDVFIFHFLMTPCVRAGPHRQPLQHRKLLLVSLLQFCVRKTRQKSFKKCEIWLGVTVMPVDSWQWWSIFHRNTPRPLNPSSTCSLHTLSLNST